MSLTVHRLTYPWHLALLSRALSPISTWPRVGSLEPSEIARAAYRSLGLSERSGEVDEQLLGSEFTEAMGLLTQGTWAPLGKIHYRAIMVAAARSRILIEQRLRASAPTGKVDSPVFVVGLPRTGTSLAQRLIAADPKRRGLMTYELLTPTVQGPPSWWSEMKRKLPAALASVFYRICTPELIKIHHTAATSLEECWMLFMASYSVLNADYIQPTTSFGDWLLKRDMVPAYERYRTQLGFLTEHDPRPLVLKSPEHLWFLDALFQVFPDARVIWTHRDPGRAVPSYCAQMSLPMRQHRGAVDSVALGARVLHRFTQGIERAEAALSRYPTARIAHLDYSALMNDPIAALSECYCTLDLDISLEHKEAMRRFVDGPQPDKHKNRYSAQAFGLDEAEIRHRFSEYSRRYGLRQEGGPVLPSVGSPLLERPKEFA